MNIDRFLSNMLFNVEVAYRKLKQDNYHDTVNLFLRHEIAKFEESDSLEEKLLGLSKFVSELQQTPWSETALFERLGCYLSEIETRCLPKSVEEPNPPEGDGPTVFVTNNRSSRERRYLLREVNYWIHAPIELHILDVLWCILVGAVLERDFDVGCLGNRLEVGDSNDSGQSSSRLFRVYHHQYSQWRDRAINIATTLLDQDINVLIIGLDLKQCFYNLSVDFSDICALLETRCEIRLRHLSIALTKVIELIHRKYHEVTRNFFAITHNDRGTAHADAKNAIPVGLASSRVLSNWELAHFDRAIRDNLRPAYYGRYVDDILIVLGAPRLDVVEKGVKSIIEEYFIKTEILKRPLDGNDRNGDEYELCHVSGMRLQKKKLIIHFFDHKHSRAGLTEFSREIAQQASEFRFLPHSDATEDLDQCAYDILYKGSVNKLRSVIGLAENSTELSKYLSRRQIQYRLCSDGMRRESIDQLFRFYRGRNMFDFCRLWEKVFSLFIVTGRVADCEKFYKLALFELDQICLEPENNDLKEKVIKDSKYYLSLALAMPIGLIASKFESNTTLKRFRPLDRVKAISQVRMRCTDPALEPAPPA